MGIDPPADGIRIAEGDDVRYIEEAVRPYWHAMSLQDLRQRHLSDRSAGQCRGDLAVRVNGARTIVGGCYGALSP